MPKAFFRFLGELNDFLPAEQRDVLISYPLDGLVAVKHPIESLGVPHPEVDLILANGRAVDFQYYVNFNDRITVYPHSQRQEVKRRLPLRPPLPRPVRFVLDTHLGQLASYLRLFGFDTLYRNDYDDAQLAQIASEDRRVLLTRDRGLLKRKIVVYGYCVRENDPRRQLISVLQRYQLSDAIDPWRRCVRCNGMLKPVAKADVLDQLEPKTKIL